MGSGSALTGHGMQRISRSVRALEVDAFCDRGRDTPHRGYGRSGARFALIMAHQIDLFCVPQLADTECLDCDQNGGFARGE